MKIYLSAADAVFDLHQKGYINDFHLSGNDLLWIQEKIFIRVGEFSIDEYHKIINPKKSMDQLVIFGVYAPWHNVKGVLVIHDKNYRRTASPVIRKKLNELHILDGVGSVV